MAHVSDTKMTGSRLEMTQNSSQKPSKPFSSAVSLGSRASKMSEKNRPDRKIDFQNTFNTKCINIVIDSIGPSIILRSI